MHNVCKTCVTFISGDGSNRNAFTLPSPPHNVIETEEEEEEADGDGR